MLYVGDGDAEGTGDVEVTVPFWDVAGVETEDAESGGLPESFPSASDGTAAPRICTKSSRWAG